jgi:uncharacterized membrane protein YvbJ
MVCQKCGTEIADKAIVCFRCGQATVAAVRKPAPRQSPIRGILSLIALVVLALAALFLGQAGTIDVPPAVRYAVMGAALAVLAWRLIARRR